jgi:Holliday junction resolvasome RuvABC ATP-dependent DNA helicase subunit
VEGILFASGEPVAADRIAVALDLDRDTVDQVFAAALVPSRGEHAAPRGRVSAESPAALSV